MILRQPRSSRTAASATGDLSGDTPTTVEVVDTDPGADPADQRLPIQGASPDVPAVSSPPAEALESVTSMTETGARGVASSQSGQDGSGPTEEDEGDGDGHFEGRDPLRFNNWMKRSTTGAILTGISIGLQQALEVPRQQPAFVIEANDGPDDGDGPIDLRFDPDSPSNTIAIIRRPAEPDPPDSP
jgi:hypothetical protein